MIRLAIITDTSHVVGSSDDSSGEVSTARLAALPERVLDALYAAEAIAVGAGALAPWMTQAEGSKVYALTRDRSFEPGAGFESVIPIHDYMDLVRRYADSDDELVVAGGATIWRLFTPYARQIDVAETAQPVPGDVVYDDVENGDFALADVDRWVGGRTLHFVRTHLAEVHDGGEIHLRDR